MTKYPIAKYPYTFETDPIQKELALSRHKRALTLAREAAHILKERFGAKQVILFGSTVDQSRFTMWSDVDLAADGIPNDRFFAAVAAVTGLSPEFKVDLVDIADCKPSLRKAIDQEGILL